MNKIETTPEKFSDPAITAKGEERAQVQLTGLKTLWFNTGSLCNITCEHCYMDSSPKNDRLAYISAEEARVFLDEAQETEPGLEEIGFTGGEPFMNKALPAILEDVLSRGLKALVLTNAMKPLWQKRDALLDLKARYGDALALRVSIDHFTAEKHEQERGEDTWAPMIKGLTWLAENGFSLAVAGRTLWHESPEETRRGYSQFFSDHGIKVDTDNPAALVLFPEMDGSIEVPEITIHCWGILNIAPESIMCASSRMVVKRKGADAPSVVPCTLLPYEEAFDLGPSLKSASRSVPLNHPHCARFCVLGGASCSA